MRALVTDIERGATFDGPGIRTVVYFKGCPLRCLWCSNPETQKLENEFWDYDGSLYKENRTSCSGCSSTSTLKQVAKDMTLEEVFTIVMKDENFYRLLEQINYQLSYLALNFQPTKDALQKQKIHYGY